jgi:hypothetical protein
MTWDYQTACKMTFRPEADNDDSEVSFLVPEEYLWTSSGLAEIFRMCRESWHGDNKDNMFRLVSCEIYDGVVLWPSDVSIP